MLTCNDIWVSPSTPLDPFGLSVCHLLGTHHKKQGSSSPLLCYLLFGTFLLRIYAKSCHVLLHIFSDKSLSFEGWAKVSEEMQITTHYTRFDENGFDSEVELLDNRIILTLISWFQKGVSKRNYKREGLSK